MRKILWLLLLTLTSAMALTGCQDKAPTLKPITLTLYFANVDADYLVAELREVDTTADAAKPEEIAALVINQLILGPNQENLSIIFPPTTVLNSVKVENGLATVDFNSALVTDYWGGSSSELLTIYGLVNSLTSLSGIEEVQILIDGANLETLAGHVEISEPLKANSELVKPD